MLPNKIRLPAFRRSSAIGCRWCMKHPTMLLLLVLPYWWSVYVSISLHWMKTEPNLSPINEVEWHGEDARRNINHVVCWYVEMCVVMDNKFHSLTCPCLISCVAATMCYRLEGSPAIRLSRNPFCDDSIRIPTSPTTHTIHGSYIHENAINHCGASLIKYSVTYKEVIWIHGTRMVNNRIV